MGLQNLHKPYEIEFCELQQFTKDIKRNNFFELIYIADGTGVQYVNGLRFSYRKGNLFLLTPQDRYSFEVLTPTRFFFLRFTHMYLNTKHGRNDDTIQHITHILQNASHRPGCILKNAVDKPLIASLVESIMHEQNNRQIYHTNITGQLVNTIITIVARNIALKLPKKIKENTGELILEILNYIQDNIFEPRMLKVEALGKHFSISYSYLGRYFKKQTGETLQQYIANYKLRIVETRLLHTDMRISEIATELNYTDESHLNRAFKKLKKQNPTDYRKLYAPAER